MSAAVQHKASTKALVVELSAGGWGAAGIRRILRGQGISPIPTLKTIRMWTDEEYAEKQRAEARARMRDPAGMNFRWPGLRSPEWRVGRIKALAAIGVKHTAIAQIMSHDFPDCPLNADQVSRIVNEGRVPWTLRKAAAS